MKQPDWQHRDFEFRVGGDSQNAPIFKRLYIHVKNSLLRCVRVLYQHKYVYSRSKSARSVHHLRPHASTTQYILCVSTLRRARIDQADSHSSDSSRPARHRLRSNKHAERSPCGPRHIAMKNQHNKSHKNCVKQRCKQPNWRSLEKMRWRRYTNSNPC